MRVLKIVMTGLAAGALALSTGVALAASATSQWGQSSATNTPTMKGYQLHEVEGVVTAVDPSSGMVVVNGTKAGTEANLTARADVTDKTDVHQGIVDRKLSDLKVGEHVSMMYEGTPQKWVADDINILDPSVLVKGIEGPDM